MHRYRSAMHRISWSILIVAFALCDGVSAKDFDDVVSGHIAHPDWFAESTFNDLEGLLDEA